MTISLTGHVHNPAGCDSDCQMELPTPSRDDVVFGAYLMSHLRSHCENCGTFDTPQWRKGWFSNVLNHSVLLCNACGLKFHKGQFCPYCHYVYGKENKISEGWITCDDCGRWVHEECESLHENGADLPRSPNYAYSCPDCRHGLHPTYFDRISPPSPTSAGPCATELESFALIPPYSRENQPGPSSPREGAEPDQDERDDGMDLDSDDLSYQAK